MALEIITLKDLDFQEQEVLKQTRIDFPSYFDNAEKGINLYYEFIHLLMEQIPNSNAKIEHYALLQVYRNAYSIKAIYNLINRGYYFDVMILLRSVLESIVTVFFLYRNPRHLDQAMLNPEKFQKKFSIKKRFENINYAEGYGDFQNLCRFSHQATFNIISMFSATPQMDLFPYGIAYSEKDAALSIYLFLRHLGMSLDCLQFVFRKRVEVANPELMKKYDLFLEGLKKGVGEIKQGLACFRDQYLKLYNIKL
jgi:hypothetical protein